MQFALVNFDQGFLRNFLLAFQPDVDRQGKILAEAVAEHQFSGFKAAELPLESLLHKRFAEKGGVPVGV